MMDLVRSRYSLLLTIEVLTLLVYGFCILLNVVSGSKFTQRDTIFSAGVFGSCCVILVLTIALACRARTKDSAHIVQITCTKSYQKLQPKNIRHYGSDCAICLSPKDPTSSSLIQLGCQHDYHKDCIKECFEKTGDLRCPKCRQAPSDMPSLTSKVVVSLTSQDGFSMACQESRCSAPVTIAVEPD
ncbi:uncharacterized protein LOC144625606 [Crassostrea virginica]